MDKFDKKTYIVISAMLLIALAVSLVGWVQARGKLHDIRISDYGQYQRTFAICDDIQTAEDYDTCYSSLKDFGETLTKYELVLKRMSTTPRPKPIHSTTTAPNTMSASSSSALEQQLQKQFPNAKVKIVSTSTSQTKVQQ